MKDLKPQSGTGNGNGDEDSCSKKSSPVSKELAELLSKDVLDKIPENARISVLQAVAFQGPLPPPSLFEGYENVLPGSADRIMTMAESEQSHRQQFDNTALAAKIGDVKRSQSLSFWISVLTIGATIVISIYGNLYIAGITGLTGLLAGIANLLQKLNQSS